jgi:tetratricopeptide (TPR) repeat protein
VARAHRQGWRHLPERRGKGIAELAKIGELSLPPGFDGLLGWGRLYNRPFLRRLHGYGLCLWRLGKVAEAKRVFERILSLNPSDNQGIRFCWQDIREGRSWEELRERERGEAADDRRLLN